MQLADLITGLDARALTPSPERVRICDITEDSRTVVPGSLFIARAGLKADGRRFIHDAIRAGAVAVLLEHDPASPPPAAADFPRAALVATPDAALASALLAERFYGHPAQKLDLIGVTGTNGKTTTTTLAWQLLNAAGHRCGLIGTVLVDDGREVAPASMTTPPAIEISRALAEMVEAGCSAAALEVSSHSLHQKRIDALDFDVAVFTNLTGDHLDYHKTMEAYGQAKARLFRRLRPDALAIVNAADPAAQTMLQDCQARALRARALPPDAPLHLADAATDADPDADPSVNQEASVRILASSIDGMHLRLDGPWGSLETHVPLIGAYNAMNVLQAVAACHRLGMDAAQLRATLPSIKAPPGRLERVQTAPAPAGRAPAEPRVFVDYAHTDDALRNVLSAVHAQLRQSDARLWVVFGAGGDKDKTKRPRMGAAAAAFADRVVITSDNPRTEPPRDIIGQILEGVPPARRASVLIQVERDRAIFETLHAAAPGDVVVIAGKGHETEQIKSDGRGGLVASHFDDREVARAALAARPGASPVQPRPLANGP